jgi:plasmid stabilization system protein ParE
VTHARVTPVAAREIDTIVTALADDNPAAAELWLDRLDSALDRLGAYPRIGHRRDDLTDRPVRFYRVYSHLLVYRDDTTPPTVIDVVHAARDVAQRLRPDSPPDAR